MRPVIGIGRSSLKHLQDFHSVLNADFTGYSIGFDESDHALTYSNNIIVKCRKATMNFDMQPRYHFESELTQGRNGDLSHIF